MKSRDFIIWLDGFLHGRNELNIDNIRYIQNKIGEVNIDEEDLKQIIIEKVEHPMNPIRIQEPLDNDSMDFPGKPPTVYM